VGLSEHKEMTMMMMMMCIVRWWFECGTCWKAKRWRSIGMGFINATTFTWTERPSSLNVQSDLVRNSHIVSSLSHPEHTGITHILQINEWTVFKACTVAFFAVYIPVAYTTLYILHYCLQFLYIIFALL